MIDDILFTFPISFGSGATSPLELNAASCGYREQSLLFYGISRAGRRLRQLGYDSI
jgi:hypothetical protein